MVHSYFIQQLNDTSLTATNKGNRKSKQEQIKQAKDREHAKEFANHMYKFKNISLKLKRKNTLP